MSNKKKQALPLDVEQSAQFMENIESADTTSVESLIPHIKILWNDNCIQQNFNNRTNEGIADSAPHFFQSVDRICKSDYRPTEHDILLMRIPTPGMSKTDFTINGYHFRIFDVGGQRSERSKWIHCFDMVTAVLYVTSLSCYDQTLYETHDVNAMHESLQLFDEIINSRWFRKASMILFLNKIDVFKIKIQERPLKICFPNYNGDNSVDSCVEFINQQFRLQNKTDNVKIFHHVTCATDETCVKNVFSAVQRTVIEQVLALGSLI